ncbi:thiol-disulfide oxidoreductase DCC family protein [Roseospira visakhapatnamensis]|uniref:Putative DCC family thiol-disulfide oxidoreductase YuxK n=1 Tax=Roseospira visakhapatnamensis TaxID=390880 RepID=A0A7W6RFU5_9PROT|nr:DUF393 domain-containing protein [Roseospira visakhapatnamensis]MBB4267667.1 putative DCC family thiol-disulfide oxidoreductase YuxK [Roseospira visakhapatnamensis]
MTTTTPARDTPPGVAADPGSGADLTVFYNGACPVCRTEINHYRRIDARAGLGLGWHDVSAGRGALSAHGINARAATRRLYAIDETGHLHAGVDAFVQVWRRLPRYRWLAWLVTRPGIRPAAGLVYESVLAPALDRWNRWRHRHQTPS